MEYRILGPLEVLHDGVPVDIGRYKLRALLALLLINADAVVSTDRIIDEIWGDEASGDRQNSLWVAISGLRSALEPDREKRTDGSILLTRSPGYLINTGGRDIDALRFEQLAAEGRGLLDADPPAASLVLQEALSLWRGHALEEFTYESFAQAEIARLEEMRLATVEDRILADLRSGRDRELIGELESLVRQHPLRERLTGHLMVALHRSGRQAEALRAFGALQSRLGEELGIEPGAEISQLEERIVLDDPDLTGPGAAVPAGLSIRGYELRDRISESAVGYVYRAYQPSVGREVAVKVVRPELANDANFIRRFEAEAQMVSRLEHPGIVPLYDYWREPDAAYLVTRRFEQGSLADALASGPLDTAKALSIIEQVGAALAAAHRRGVAHGDLKPGNVLLDSEGNAYLSDFGMALPGAGGEFAAPEGAATPLADVYSLGAVAAAALRGATGVRESPLVGPTAAVVATATATDPADRYSDIETFLAELAGSVGAPSEAAISVDNPYKGLRAFEEGDAGRFFGRERLVERLIARLGHSGPQGKLIALVGPSGAGKSSVVRAGLIPAIRAGALPQSDRWFIVTMTPGRHPFEALDEALHKVAVDPPASILEQLTERGIGATVEGLLPEEGSQLLLVVDQLEELFTHTSAADADEFLDALAAAGDKHSCVKVVATLRADFYDHPLRHETFGERLRLGSEVITPMTSQELERAISGPAEGAGVSFEQSLVAQIVADMKGQSSALPLLQYALTEMFDARTGRTITTETYEELGGVSAALLRRADSIYRGLKDPEQRAARDIFLRLVTLGDRGEDTRRRALLSELIDTGGPPSRNVIDTFGRHRLLSFDRDPVSRGPTVEIAHEAMLHEWQQLNTWVEGARHDVRNQRRLAAAMAEWVGAGRDDQYLLSGGRLQQLEGWAATTSVGLSNAEQGFLDASVVQRAQLQADEMEREQRAEEAELREQRRARQLFGVGLIALVVGAAGAFSLVQWRNAEDARRVAEDAQIEAEAARIDAEEAQSVVESLLSVSKLVDASEASRTEDPELAVLYAMQAMKETAAAGFAREEAVDAVHWALQELGVQYQVSPETPVAVRPGPNGPAGVFAIQPAELAAHAEQAVDRTLTDDECAPVYGGPCPLLGPVGSDVSIFAGMEAYGGRAPGGKALAGTSLTVTSVVLESLPGFAAEMEAFEERTGIQVNVETQNELSLNTGDFEPTEVTEWFFVPEWAQEATLDLGQFLDRETLRSDFGEYLLAAVTLADSESTDSNQTDKVVAVPVGIDADPMVIYAKGTFDAAGYEVPTSWDQLLTLSEQIVADGRTPWCFGWAAGKASGFAGTDFLENLILISGGTAVYDAWASGQLSFSSQEVLEAAKLGETLLFGPGFLRGGVETVSTRPIFEQMSQLQTQNPETGANDPDCLMMLNPDFTIGVGLLPGRVLGEDLSLFPLPTFDGSQPAPLTGNLSVQWAITDRPEVRAYMEFIASPEYGERWAALAGATQIHPPNRRFDLSSYDHPEAEAVEFSLALAKARRDAMDADAWRVDASDAMSDDFASFDRETGPGPFWQAMLDWVDRKAPVEEIFAELDLIRAEIAAAD